MRHTWGHVPANLMPEYVHAEHDPLRALIVIGGNPIMAVPGEERLREAFPHLELVVTMDLFRSATAELSDYVLPVSDWLERADFRSGGVAIRPTAQYSDAVVAPVADRVEEWWILARLEQELGLPSALDDGVDFAAVVNEAMAQAAGTTIEELRTLPSHTKVLEPQPSLTLEEAVAYNDGRVDCCPPSFAPVIARAHEIFAELHAESPDALKLIQWRNRRQHNTWGRRLMPRSAKASTRTTRSSSIPTTPTRAACVRVMPSPCGRRPVRSTPSSASMARCGAASSRSATATASATPTIPTTPRWAST